MMKRVLCSILLMGLGAAIAAAQVPSSITCVDQTILTTGRTLLAGVGSIPYVNPSSYASLRPSYYTTGSPSGVGVQIEDGNQPAATQTPFVRGVAATDTSGSDFGFLQLSSRFVWVNVTTLGGGTSPTIVVTSCFAPSPIARSTSGGGSGLTSLNGLTASTQVFSAGTSGTQFGIASSSSTHTFQFPGTWFTWNNTNKGLTLTGTTSGYSLDISTATTDGLRIVRSTAGRSGILIDSVAGSQAGLTLFDGGVAQWQAIKAVGLEFVFFNAPNSLNQFVLTPGTLDTAVSAFQGELTQTRTTTNNAAVGINFSTTDNNTTGTAGGTDVDALHVAYVAGAAAAQSGNGTGINTNVTVTNTTAVASFGNEFAHIVGATVSNASNAARLWGQDFSTQSARAVADDFIQGGSYVVNRFNTGANRNGSGGLFVYTKPNSGAGVPAGNPTTYPIAVGLQVVGWSGATSLLSNSPSNATLQSRTAGFTTGIKIGGAGSGWDSPYLSDRSNIGTGLDIQDIFTTAISISNPYGGTSPPTPNLFVVTGTTWLGGIDLSGATFSSFGIKMGASLLDASAGTLKLPTSAGFVSTASSTFGIDSTTGKPQAWDPVASANTTLLRTKDPTLLATGTSVSLTAPKEYYVCTSTCTVTPPVPSAGYIFCVTNDDNVSTVITLAALGSSAKYEATARTSYGTAGTGTLVSSGAVNDQACILGLDSTHYLSISYNGTWVAN